MSKLPICNMKGDRLGELTLADDLMVLKKGSQAVHDAVEAFMAKGRSGTASTKTRAHVAGGGIKPWKQKGTGRARAGSIRSPIWRGGGVVFGPHPRSYEKKLNKKTAQLAFRRAFSERVAAGEVIVVDDLKMTEPKTKVFVDMLRKLKADRGALIVLQAMDRNVTLAARNVENVEVASANGVHTYQMLRYPTVVVTQGAMETLEGRLKTQARRAS